MHKTAATICVLILAMASASADEIKIGKLPTYTNARIIKVRDCRITFIVAGGRGITKSAADIVSVKVAGQTSFNKAEDLLKNGKPGEAVKSYEAAVETASKPWMKELVRYRLLRGLEQAAMTDRAVRNWLDIVDRNNASKPSLALRPGRRLAPKGARANAEAISLLEAKLKGVTDKAYKTAIEELLFGLYRHEGRQEKAEAMAAQISGEGGAEKASLTSDSLGARLGAAAVLLDSGKSPEKVLENIQSDLGRFSPSELPTAMLLAGRAEVMLSQKAGEAEDARKLLLAAGLDFMRVAAFFPGSTEAPEALYRAGAVNAELGNKPAAVRAYETVISLYGKTESAGRARAALEAMKK